MCRAVFGGHMNLMQPATGGAVPSTAPVAFLGAHSGERRLPGLAPIWTGSCVVSVPHARGVFKAEGTQSAVLPLPLPPNNPRPKR